MVAQTQKLIVMTKKEELILHLSKTDHVAHSADNRLSFITFSKQETVNNLLKDFKASVVKIHQLSNGSGQYIIQLD